MPALMETAMSKRSSLLAILPAVLLAGCAGTPNRGLESVHQPVVQRTDFAFDVNTANGHLAPGERARLTGWMDSLRIGYGDRIAVDTASPYDAATRDDVSRVIARYGLLLSADTPVTPAPVTPGTARVIVTRASADVPGCPEWTRNSGIDYDENTWSNYGCATNANMAAMVANPGDLVRGRSAGDLADPAVSSKAIDTFRKAPNTGAGTLKSESSTQGGGQ